MTKNSAYKIILFISVLLGYIELNAQEKIDSTLIERNGKKFYTYVVAPGNTLYSISKQYNLSVNEIQEYNPKSKQGLSIGDTLFILAVEQDKSTMGRRMEVDGNVIVHEVQKGQTLYAISKIYDIGTGDILSVNPEIKGGLKEGQLIKIPVAKLKEEEIVTKVPDSASKDLIHIVKSKETLYSISRFYSVTIEQLKEANNGLLDGLKVGQKLVIPIQRDQLFSPLDTTIMKEAYNIGLILPFFLDLNDTLISHLKINEKESVIPKSIAGIQFYQGFKLAIDSIDPEGKRFKVHVFDGAKDSVYVKKLLDDGTLKSMDLIVGPLYFSQFLEVAEMAKKEKIHIVCPVPQSNKVLLGNPYVSKVATSQNILFKNLASYLSKFYKSENVIVVTKNFRANPLSHSFKEELLELMSQTGDSSTIVSIKEIKWDNGSVSSIQSMLKEGIFNVIILPSDDQAYVTEFLSNLNSIRKEYMFIVVGVDKWLRYTNIDFEYFENLNAMIPVDGYVNVEDSATKDYFVCFYKRYKIFPEKYSFIGSDIAFYYTELLWEGGTRIEPLLPTKKARKLYYKFDYFKTGIESGYENESVFFLKQDQFKIVEVPVIK